MEGTMIALTSYGTSEFNQIQTLLVKSAIDQGAHRVSMWHPEHLKETKFYERHRDILDRPRGGGYWLWKPYIILMELERLGKGDYLIYHDCGRKNKPDIIRQPLHHATQWVHDNLGGMLPGSYTPRYGRNAKWTKGECFAVMGCEAPLYKEHPQIQASVSVWERHDASMDFVREWLHWCTNPAALLDDRIDPTIPDDPDFVDHRHDQSVLTLLAIKRGLKCMGSPLECHYGERKINGLIERIKGEALVESFARKLPVFVRDFPELAAA